MPRKKKFSITKPKTPEEKIVTTTRWIAAGFGLAYMVFFFDETRRLLLALWDLVLLLGAGKEPTVLFTPATMQAFLTYLQNLLVFVFLLSFFLWLTAQFTLPVRGWRQRNQVYQRLRMYLQGGHGPAIFVREGKQIGTKEEIKREGPGVAFVDHSSAIVLEAHRRAWLYGGISLDAQMNGGPSGGLRTRAAGPGVVFIRPNEKIRGTVDLRKQARAVPNVHAYTRDGIDLTTVVISIFSLGMNPDILKVGYIGHRPEDLRVVYLDERTTRGANGALVHTRAIRDLADEFDVDDRNEIYLYYQSVLQTGLYPAPDEGGYSFKEKTLYSFDENRVKAAIYSEARNLQENTVSPWVDLPGQVAVQILRDMMMQKTYDDWFRIDGEKPPAIRGMKGRFSQVMRHQGLLGFQLVERADGQPLVKGQPWEESELIIHPPRMLRSQKVLRERGIRVIAGVFTDPKPKEQIRQQFFNKWQAAKQEGIKSTRATYDLRVMEAINDARTRAQKDMLINFSRILQSKQYSQEALALRMFQTLETIASDAATSKLLPQDTFSLLRSLGTWLNVDSPQPTRLPAQPAPDLLDLPHEDITGRTQDDNPGAYSGDPGYTSDLPGDMPFGEPLIGDLPASPDGPGGEGGA
jgi:hypothetical protein